MFTPISAITGTAPSGSACRHSTRLPPSPFAARGADEVVAEHLAQLRAAHPRDARQQRRPDDQAGQPGALDEAQRVLERAVVAADRREERDLHDRAHAGREQQQHHQPDPVDRRGEHERDQHRDHARGERVRPRGLDRAGEQPEHDREQDRAREQVHVDEEPVGDHVERAAGADERPALEALGADVGVQERRAEVGDELPEQVQRGRVVALDEREHQEAQRRDEHEREHQQREAPREEGGVRAGHRGPG